MTFVKPCSHVLFKSESHHGVFMTQNSVSDLPGGSAWQGGPLQGAELAQCQKEGAEALLIMQNAKDQNGYEATMRHSKSSAALIEKEKGIYRVAVLFKSADQLALFTVKRGVLNLPGGMVHDDETYEDATVRVVEEELGGWPAQVSQSLEPHSAVNCGITKYYVTILNEEDFKSTFAYFGSLLEGRGQTASCNVGALRVEPISIVCAIMENEVSREVEKLFEVMRERGLLDVNADRGPEAAPPQTVGSSSRSSTDAAPAAPAASPSAEVAARSVVAVAPATAEAELANAAIVPVTEEAGVGNIATQWRCSSCRQGWTTLRQCWECYQWDCKSCSFWCTKCPKGDQQYTICGHCNTEGGYLQRSGQIWRCRWCLQA